MERNWSYTCETCGKERISERQLKEDDISGWTMEVDPPSGPGGYSVFRVYCPSCSKRRKDI